MPYSPVFPVPSVGMWSVPALRIFGACNYISHRLSAADNVRQGDRPPMAPACPCVKAG